jgi:tetratricopeptide (TPR) repeat protein
MNLAQENDPTSGSVLADQAVVRYAAGDRAGAIAELHEVERDEPDFWAAPRYLAVMWLNAGDFPAYLAEMKRYAQLSKNPEAAASNAAAERGWAQGGRRGLLHALRKVQEDLFRNGQMSGYDLARTCAMLGDDQEAVADLKAAYRARDFRLLDLVSQAWTSPLQGDPEFEHLLRQIDGDLNRTA